MSDFFVVLRKELKDIFRDKKTIIFTLLLPIIIYPALFAMMDFSMKDNQKKIDEGIKIGVVDHGKSSIMENMKANNNFIIKEGTNLDNELKEGVISAIIEIPEDFNTSIEEEKLSGIKIIYDETSNVSSMAVNEIQTYLSKYSEEVVANRLEKRGISSDVITPFNVEVKAGNENYNEDSMMGTVILNMLPTIILLFMFMPTMVIAADLGAGEKERGTLEPLLSTASRRSSVLWGKVTATITVAFVTLMVTVAAILVSVKLIFRNVSAGMSFDIRSIIVLVVFCVLFLVVISSVELALSIYSKSMKEANSYMTAIMIVGMIFIYIPMMMDAKTIEFKYFNIPITNVVCIMKEAIAGIFDVKHMLVVLAWTVVYVGVAMVFANRMFNKEEAVLRV